MSDGKKEQLTGRVKEAAGALIDDDELKNEGKVEQAAGDVKEAVGQVVDKLRKVFSSDD